MSLANIPLIELNKSVSASLRGSNSHEESGPGENFSRLLMGPIGSKGKTGQEAVPESEEAQKAASELGENFSSLSMGAISSKDKTGQEAFPESEEAQKAAKIANLIKILNSTEVMDHSDFLLEGAKDFGGLENLISEFEAQAGEKKSLLVVNENSTIGNNKEVYAFLSLLADFRKQITKNDEGEVYLKPSSSVGELDLDNTIEVKPLHIPEHSRTPDAAYPNEKLQLISSKRNFPIELPAEIRGSGNLGTPTPSEPGMYLESDTDLSNNPVKTQKPLSSEHGYGLQGGTSEIIKASSHEDKLGQNPNVSEPVGAKQVKEDLIRKSAMPEGGPKDQIIPPQKTTKAETNNPLVDRSDLKDKQTAYFSAQESKTLKTEKPENEPAKLKSDGSENLGKTAEQAVKKISIGNEKKSKFDVNAKDGLDIKGPITSNKNLSPQERQPALNVMPNPNKYQAFSDNAFRLRSSEVSNQKNSLKSRSGTNFAVENVAASFAKAIDALNRPQESKNIPSEVKFEEALVEAYAPRTLSVQVSSSTSSISNSPSLEMLEKWVDSQLDLNSRGWVSNLSKSMLSALSRGQQKLTITLSPESLGKLNITFGHGVKGLDIRINAERQATAALIGDAEAKLVSNIEASGQRVASVTCSSSNSFENAYNSSQNSSSNGNNENSDGNQKSQTRKPEQNVEKADSDETVGKSNDDDTIVNITI